MKRRGWITAIGTIGLLAGAAAAAVPARARTGPVPVTLTVDASRSLGPTNERLAGVGWNTGPIDGIIPLQPPTVRIDASLQSASQGPNQLDLSGLLHRISEVRRAGAEPQVVLSYMPPWLAQTLPFGLELRDPTRLGPRDLDAWQRLIEQVVQAAATAPDPAYRFEVWNEPDLPVFFLDTPIAFLRLARRTHAAVAAVEARTGLHLEIGGPAAALPDPVAILAYRAATAGVRPPDFISWHFYGNMLLGPDGNEGLLPGELYRLISGRNPLTTPMLYRAQTDLIRALVGPDVDLVIDEWNLSAGGFDRRHDSNEGAAFQAASLIEMERAGLDAADLYRGVDDPGHGGRRVGDWGLVDSAGQPKPSWWVFDAWRRTAGTRLATTGDQPLLGWWSRATRAGDHVDVLLSSFDAAGGGPARSVALDVRGFAAACAEVRTIDGPQGSFAEAGPSAVTLALAPGRRPTVRLPAQSVVWVRLQEACGG